MEKDNNTQAQEELTSTSEDWTSEAFPEAHNTNEEAPDLESKEEEIPTPNKALVKNAENDEKRYQYWQSQSDKLRNENEQLKAQIQEQQAPAPAQAEEAPVEAKEFPPPPDRPRRPASYSKDEGISDPNSVSARYNDALDDWRDRMDKYNNLYAQYNVALAQERMDKLEGKITEKEQQEIAMQQNQQAVAELSDYVQATYGLTQDETQDFIQTMSAPDSLTIGNLVDLYKMKGKQVIENVPTQVGTEVNSPQFQSEPSDTFKQVKRAQQVPSPMGVLSGNRETKTTTDSIMDEMIDTFNKKNPF